MSKYLMAVLSFSIFISIALIAFRAWKAKASEQELEFTAPLEALEEFGEELFQTKAFYVATTMSSNHLERIKAYGLGSRGDAKLFVFAEGVLVLRTGERPLAIEAQAISGVETAQVAIDKVVEEGGLLNIIWSHDSKSFSTFLRISEQSVRDQASNQIIKLLSTTAQREAIK